MTRVVYETSVKEGPSEQRKTNTGATARQFKQRNSEHGGDTRKEEGRAKTDLSAQIWGHNEV